MTDTLFTNAHVFTGLDFVDTDQDVLFRDGRVVELGTGLAAQHPGAEVVDLAGNTLLPGLTDLHVHLTIQGAGSVKTIHEPFAAPYYKAVAHMRATLAAGITSVRDAGGAELGTRWAVEQGIVPGPRMRLAIGIISQTGGHGDGVCASGLDIPLMPVTPGRPRSIADGVDEVRKTTRELLRAGADQIKICSTGGVLSPTDDPRHSQFTVDEIATIVAEATAQGSYVMAHAQGTEGIKNALRAGVRTIEHGVYLDDEAIELFLAKDAWLVPTLVAPVAVVRAADKGDSGLAPQVIEKAHRVVDEHAESVRRAHEAGVNIAMGTDSGVGIHGENLEELHLMATRAGMSLTDVLVASTSAAGQFIGEGIGRLEPGSVGDAVVLDTRLTSSDQLADLRSHITAVYQDGKRVTL